VDSSALPTKAMRLGALKAPFELSEMMIKSQYALKLRTHMAMEKQKYGREPPKLSISNTIDGSSPPLNFQFTVEQVYGEGVAPPDTDCVEGCTSRCRPDMGKGIGCEYTDRCDCLEYAHVNEGRLQTPAQLEQYKNRAEVGTRGLPKHFPYRRATGASDWNKKVCPWP
jgi:histone-lysine N-methyltransferase SUV39H